MTVDARSLDPVRKVRPASRHVVGSTVHDPGEFHVCMFTAEAQKGHARYTHDLLDGLAQAGEGRGFRFSLVTGEDLSDRYRSTRYEIHPMLPPLVDRRGFRWKWQWACSRLAHYYRREQRFLRWVSARPDIDLVHFQEYTPWLAPSHFRRLRSQGKAVVATVHNITNYAHLSRSYVQRTQNFWRTAWRSCSGLIVHTEDLRDTLSEYLEPGHPPIFVTPHAVWEERITPPTPVDPPRKGGPAQLLFFGMIRPNKGLHVLMKAMGELPDCELTVVGDSEMDAYFEEIRGLAAQLPPGRVRIENRFVEESEIAAYFDESHLVVLPYTEFASQSGVLHQALAHGRPVVASDLGGMGRSVHNWGIGTLVPAGDPQALAAAIRRAMEPETFRAAAAATRRIRETLTWTAMAEATLDGYQSVLD